MITAMHDMAQVCILFVAETAGAPRVPVGDAVKLAAASATAASHPPQQGNPATATCVDLDTHNSKVRLSVKQNSKDL